ncbi:colony stimulating factor 3 (granulocyte) a [Salminus brasiliensis]|uniref:colony stimulating factor 3 (granulocyte) a n=1 Tax=Salminus brasiliensis TaxID=930266 RepID=UPI003B835DE5
MHLFLGLPLTLCVLSLASSAPVLESRRDMQDPKFEDAVENGHSLISKILSNLPAVHKSWIHSESLSLDRNDSGKLQYLKDILNLPTAPALKPLSDDFTLAACLGQIAEGLRLHQTTLTVVNKLALVKSEKVDGLLYDIRDLLTQVQKMQKLTGTTSAPETQAVAENQLQTNLAPRLQDEYTSQVAAHLVLLQLRDFSQDVSRSFRSIISLLFADPDSQTTVGWN